jgi:hypothetical protein
MPKTRLTSRLALDHATVTDALTNALPKVIRSGLGSVRLPALLHFRTRPKAASTMGPVTRRCAVTRNASREWSSSQVKISVPRKPCAATPVATRPTRSA